MKRRPELSLRSLSSPRMTFAQLWLARDKGRCTTPAKLTSWVSFHLLASSIAGAQQ